VVNHCPGGGVYPSMTAMTRPVARSSSPPAVTAQLVLGIAILVNLVLVEVLFATGGPAKNTLTGIGRFLGLHAAFLMILQLVLVARLPWLDRRLGMDKLTAWHRVTGFLLLWCVLLHLSFILLGYGQLDNLSVLTEFTNLAGALGTVVGIAAATIVVIVGITSVRYARRRLPYETWHTVHLLLYAAVLLALVHQLFEGSAFKTSIVAEVYWWALWAFAIISLIAGRMVVPILRNVKHQYRVAAVVSESDDIVSVHITGKNLEQLPARAGQFMIWRFPGYGHWWEANPFSLSAAPNGRSLRLTAKAVGSASAGLRNVPVGTRVFAEGPYGALTALQRATGASVLIAGGIGITPIRSLMEELTGPITVLYRVQTMADAVLLDELQALAGLREATLHVLSGRTGAGAPLFTPFAPHDLSVLVPDIAARDVFICGPDAMTVAVLRSLKELGVPQRQVHAERFRLAGRATG
jgi:predicted ferric reductase